MSHDDIALYSALSARDARFDGVFFVGVTSTGIYCRPVCTAKTPKAPNCRFFGSPEAAEGGGFRPCLRCRPELAPGSAPVDDAQRIAGLIAARLEEGAPDEEGGIEAIAAQFELSSRQIRRIIQKEFGVSPIELVLTRRLLLAKQLLTETHLRIIDVAYASGFASLRRFNDAFTKRYGMPPTRLRKASSDGDVDAPPPMESLALQLGYRPPFDWAGMLQFLAGRAMRGVELVEGDAYLRTVRLGDSTGWIRARNTPEKRALRIEIAQSLAPVLPTLLARLRHVFDLKARPDVIVAMLSRDEFLRDAVARNPGQRVPGAFAGFELAVRAILGQQLTVKAATTLSGRFVDRFGEACATPYEGLNRLSPTAERIARAKIEDIASLGIIETRARSIVALAKEIASGRLTLAAGSNPDATIQQLVALPGIGAWTAHYIAMRALAWPDAFPKEDIALRKALGGVTAARAEAMSQAWRPWRGYAVMHLWRNPPLSPKSEEAT